MGRATTDDDITLAQRYECKYLVSPVLASSIRQFIGPFMQPDPHAAVRPGYRYPISSLYLDSDDLVMYQQTVAGEKNRFKLRIRTYSDEPAHPAFLEVKRKVNSIVFKRRARVGREQVAQLLESRSPARVEVPDGERDDLAFFANRMGLTGAKPLIRVRYLREAYESRGGDPVRLTLDSDLYHAVTLDGDLRHGTGRWVRTPLDGVILELKFTDGYPGWVHHLVRAFGLRQQPMPKYVMCVDHVLLAGRETALAVGGFTLPPWRA